jgi:predicted DNA-binding protein
MYMSKSEKVVQTELPEEEYERLTRIAEKEDKSLKQLLREAANEYTNRHEEIDFDDPFFQADVGESGTDEKTAKKTDEYLYG